MKKNWLIYVFVTMFLSCGTSNNAGKWYEPLQPAEIGSAINSSNNIVVSKLDSFISNLNKTGAFNGSILVARGGKILFRKSVGYCDKQNNCLLNDSSMFQLASVSKVVTATAVLMLYERELIDITKPFSFYFPDFPYENITVKNLLTHRSGLPNYIYALHKEIYQPDYKMTNADMYNYFKEKNPKPYLKPDKVFNYCNTNYALLALLVEKVSGKKFSQFLKEELFEPLGMKHTATIADFDLNNPNITKPYDQRWRPVAFDASDYVLGDKSLYSTAYDLFLFSEALYQNKIIKAETQQLAYAAYSKEKKLSNYGFGWRIKDFKDSVKKEVFHNGWWHGYRSAFHRRLKDTLTVVVLSNQLNKATYQTQKIYEILDNTSSGFESDDDE